MHDNENQSILLAQVSVWILMVLSVLLTFSIDWFEHLQYADTILGKIASVFANNHLVWPTSSLLLSFIAVMLVFLNKNAGSLKVTTYAVGVIFILQVLFFATGFILLSNWDPLGF